jgi:hypothetical protein
VALLVFTVALSTDSVVTRAAFLIARNGVVLVLGASAVPVGGAANGDAAHSHDVMLVNVHEVLDRAPSRVPPRVQTTRCVRVTAGRRDLVMTVSLLHMDSVRWAERRMRGPGTLLPA